MLYSLTMNGVEIVASWLTPTVIFCVMNLIIGAIFVISRLKLRSNPPKASENGAVSPPQLERVPSLFERVNSIKLSFSRSVNRDPVPASTTAHDDVPNQDQARHVTRSKSDKAATASEPAAEGELGGGDEAVDARADDFINRFRQQLKMQRLDSLLRYREMLRRSGS